jgi:hypothetical protein
MLVVGVSSSPSTHTTLPQASKSSSIRQKQQEQDDDIKDVTAFSWPSNFTGSSRIADDEAGSYSVATTTNDGVVKQQQQQPQKGRSWLIHYSEDQVKFGMIVSLLGVSGMVEAICYRYYKCFPNLLTGNTFKVLDCVVDGKWKEASWTASMVVLYVVGASLYKAIDTVQYHQQQQQQQQILESSSSLSTTSSTTNVRSILRQHAKTLTRTLQLTVVAFALSDVVDYGLFPGQNFPVGRLPFLSLGFGMINAASAHLLGAVTNAVTGHWTKLGMSLAESLMAGTSTMTTSSSISISTSTSTSTPPSTAAATKTLRRTAWGLAVFCFSVGTTLGILRVIEPVADQSLGLMIRLPPLGLSLGVVYGLLLTGYSKYLILLSDQQEEEEQR